MKLETKERTYLALMNASEFIRSHAESGGIFPEDVNEYDEQGLTEYHKACEKDDFIEAVFYQEVKQEIEKL